MDGRLPLKWARITLLPFRPSRTLISRGDGAYLHPQARVQQWSTCPRAFSSCGYGCPETRFLWAAFRGQGHLCRICGQTHPSAKKKLSDSFKNANPERIKLANALTEARKPLPVDPQIKQLQDKLDLAQKPVPLPPEIARLRRALELSKGQLAKKRIVGAQDLAWAIINTPAFLFNR